MNYLKTLFKIWNIFNVGFLGIILSIFVLIIDNKDLIYSLIISVELSVIIPTSFLTLMVIAYLVKSKLYNLITSKSINNIDLYLSTSLVCSLFLLSIYNRYLINYNNQYKLYKELILIVLLIVQVLIFIVRFIRFSSLSERESNIFDLKDLYDNTIHKSVDKVIMISEKDVEYDILGRDFLIGQLEDTIIYSNPNSKLVLGLTGKWGYGKTTIINNLKNKLTEHNNILIIDNFDPWKYNDEKSMFKAMYTAIIKKIDIGMLEVNTKLYLSKYVNALFDDKKSFIINELFLSDNDLENSKLVNLINMYLKNHNKTILFIIDNIDRTQPHNMFFVYKSVAALLNFNHITYLLSYDETIVKKAFKKLGIEYKYLDKIIQKKFELPNSDNKLINVMKTCLINYYSLSQVEISKINENIIYDIVKTIDNLRDFKLYINNISHIFITSLRKLFISDFLSIALIKNRNIDLYNEIFQNRKYYISYGIMEDADLFGTRISGDDFEKKAKEYFANLFKHTEHSHFQSILSNVFPAVSNFTKGYSIYPTDKEGENESTVNKRACNAKFFNSYFINSVNSYIKIDELVNDFLELFKLKSIEQSKLESFKDILIAADPYVQRLIIENVEIKVEVLDSIDLKKLALFLFDNYEIFDGNHSGFVLSSRVRLFYVITKLITTLSIEDYEECIIQFTSRFKDLYAVRSLCYWLSDERTNPVSSKPEYYEKINERYLMMINQTVWFGVNIYDCINYNRYNLSCLVKNIDTDEIKKYLTEIINEKNITKFIFDFTQVSTSSRGYGYRANIEAIFDFIPEEKVDELISKSDSSKDNEFIKKVYENSKVITDQFYDPVLIDNYVELTFDC